MKNMSLVSLIAIVATAAFTTNLFSVPVNFSVKNVGSGSTMRLAFTNTVTHQTISAVVSPSQMMITRMNIGSAQDLNVVNALASDIVRVVADMPAGSLIRIDGEVVNIGQIFSITVPVNTLERLTTIEICDFCMIFRFNDGTWSMPWQRQ